MNKRRLLTVFILMLLASISLKPLQAGVVPTPEEVYQIGLQAYIYAYPLVLVEQTRQVFIQRFPMNRFNHARAFPPPEAKTVVRPNIDTLYSSAWLDLSKEPIILSLPDTGGRYYLVQIMDAWTETISVPGKRTTGTQAGQLVIVGPNWMGSLPSNMAVIKSPTNLAWIIGRIQTNTMADYPNVHVIQKGFNLVPLSGWGRGESPFASPGNIPARPVGHTMRPPVQVAAMNAETFFMTFAALLKENPPHPEDAPLVARLKTIGLSPGEPFDWTSLNPESRHTLERAVREAKEKIINQLRASNPEGKSWRINKNVGRYGTDYLTRAATALAGLGALPAEEAIYTGTSKDSSGSFLRGSNRYVVHFEKSGLPPVQAFWSVTLYNREGFFVPNPLNRYGLGDRDPLKFNKDGSLDLYIQQAKPAQDLETNWLPAPNDVFALSLRMYWPGPEVLSGQWTPPVIRRVE